MKPLVYSFNSQDGHKFTECVPYLLGCESVASRNNQSFELCSRPRVLFFGAIKGSFMAKREDMCNVRNSSC